jgi:hypothetical protein
MRIGGFRVVSSYALPISEGALNGIRHSKTESYVSMMKRDFPGLGQIWNRYALTGVKVILASNG